MPVLSYVERQRSAAPDPINRSRPLPRTFANIRGGRPHAQDRELCEHSRPRHVISCSCVLLA